MDSSERVGIARRSSCGTKVCDSDAFCCRVAAKKRLPGAASTRRSGRDPLWGRLLLTCFFLEHAAVSSTQARAKNVVGIRLSAACLGFVSALGKTGVAIRRYRIHKKVLGHRAAVMSSDHRLHRPRDLRHLWRWCGPRSCSNPRKTIPRLIDFLTRCMDPVELVV